MGFIWGYLFGSGQLHVPVESAVHATSAAAEVIVENPYMVIIILITISLHLIKMIRNAINSERRNNEED